MAQRSPSRRRDIAASKLRAPTRTTYYNCFFLFKTEVVLNGQPAEIGCSEEGELSLSCRRSDKDDGSAQISISFPSISARVEEILKKHGVFEVVTFFCEDSPLFQVTFSSEHSLKKFIKSRGRAEKEMSTLFSKMLQPTQQTGATANPIPAQVNATLCLMVPDWFDNRCGAMEVSLDNYSSCISVWRDSKVFEFGIALKEMKGIDTSSRQSKGTSTSDLRQFKDESTNTNLTPFQDKDTSTSDLRPSQEKGTTTSDLRPSQEKGTSTSDLKLSQEKGTSTSDLRLSQEKGTTTSDLRLSEEKGTSTSNLKLSQEKGASMSDLRQSQNEGTSDPKNGTLGYPQKLQRDEITVGSVLKWLEEVFEWLQLGIYLEIPHHELKIIEQNYPRNSKQCMVEMVHTWIKRGASWSALVGALWETGRRPLAKKLADKFEIALPANDTDQSESSAQCELLTAISQKDQCLEDTKVKQALVEEQRNKGLEDIAQTTRQLKEYILKLRPLEQERKQLTTQLKETQEGLRKLQDVLGKQTYAVVILSQQTAKLQDQLGQKDTEIAMITAVAEELKTKLEVKTEKLKTASKELNELKKEQQALKSDLERKRQELAEEQYKSVCFIQELKGELSAMRAEANTKEREISALGEKLSSQNAEVERLRKELHEAEQRKSALPEQPSAAAAAATVQQQLLHAVETSELGVELATAEEGRQEVERQLGALKRQMQLLEEEFPDTSQCTATRYGANNKVNFKVHLVNKAGQPCTIVKGVEVTASLSDGSNVTNLQVTFKDLTTYDISYVPTTLGMYKLDVKVNNTPIGGSPFKVETVAHQAPVWQLCLKTTDEQTQLLNIYNPNPPAMKVSELKQVIKEKTGVPPRHQRLMSKAKQLDNEGLTLGDYGLSPLATITMYFELH